MTDKLDPPTPRGMEGIVGSDLARRLARYRNRIRAEGRPRSLKLIERAIEDAGKENSESA